MNFIKNKNPIFIGGCPKSGTTLMAALLDDHPDLLVFPEPYLYICMHQIKNKNYNNLIESMLGERVSLRMQGKENISDQVNEEQKNYNDFNYKLFLKESNACFEELINRNEIKSTIAPIAIQAIVNGYSLATHQKDFSKWIIKNPKYELYWKQVFKDFPDALMIIMLRDPRDVILSRTLKLSKKKHLLKGRDVDKWSINTAIRPSIYYLEDWKRSIDEINNIKQVFPDQILLIRYEDLLGNPRSTMLRVTDFLKIRWNDSLLKPSFRGIIWHGNSMRKQKFNSIGSPDSLKRTIRLPFHRLWQIESWLGEIMLTEPVKYSPSGVLNQISIRAFFDRLSGESLLTFLKNRLAMWRNWRNA